MFRLKFTGTFSCSYKIAAEQKARSTYDNLLRLIDDPDVRDPIKFLRQREVTHFQRFGEANRFGKQKTPAPLGAGVSNAQKRLTWKPLQRGLLRSSSEQP